MKTVANKLDRRDFLKSVGLAAPLLLAAPAMVTGCATVKSYGAHSHKRGKEISAGLDRKSTRLNSSHLGISYAVFCLKTYNSIGAVVSRRGPPSPPCLGRTWRRCG